MEKSKVDQLIELAETGVKTTIGGIEFDFMPLNNKEVLSLIKQAEKGDVSQMMLKMIHMTLAKNTPEIALEKVEQLPYLLDFVKAIAELNHLQKFFPSLFDDFQKAQGTTMQSPLSKDAIGSSRKGVVDLSQIS